jgi:hypothetical protein
MSEKRHCVWLEGSVRSCTVEPKIYIEWMDGEKWWYCAKHYDIIAQEIIDLARRKLGARRVALKNNLII